MRLLFDVNHPVQVHVLRPLARHFAARGDSLHVVARDKDVSVRLLQHYGLAHETPVRTGRGRAGLMRELVLREWHVWRRARTWRPHLIVGTSVHAARVARLCAATSVVINDDDARANPAFARLAYPLAHVILTPECLRHEAWGARQHTFPGNQQLFYLHPARFRPDPGVRAELGLRADERFVLLRLSALEAHHDRGVRGLDAGWVQTLGERLRGRARVFVSGEKPLQGALETLRFPLRPERLHDALAAADAYVGDSQSVTAEAAVLGTPAFRLNDFVGRLSYLAELERHELAFGFRPGQEAQLLDALLGLLARAERGALFAERRQRFLEACGDPLPAVLALLERLGQAVESAREPRHV